MAVNYVKFMRGTQALYNSLATKDQDTLYFVYDNVGDDHGKLYLGNKLISGSSSFDGNISVADIADVVTDDISEAFQFFDSQNYLNRKK